METFRNRTKEVSGTTKFEGGLNAAVLCTHALYLSRGHGPDPVLVGRIAVHLQRHLPFASSDGIEVELARRARGGPIENLCDDRSLL